MEISAGSVARNPEVQPLPSFLRCGCFRLDSQKPSASPSIPAGFGSHCRRLGASLRSRGYQSLGTLHLPLSAIGSPAYNDRVCVGGV